MEKNEFAFIVKNTPLISIDLVIVDNRGKILVGLRNNEPARGKWFVPGGRIYKNESIESAFSRISSAELGISLEIKKAEMLGVFEHIYDTNFANSPGFGTHYVVLAYRVYVPDVIVDLPQDQHRNYLWITEQDLEKIDVHPNTEAYFYC
ncbi:MAG: GDP-mannose mannosyl hydrolase [Cyanobacteria bacterium J06642_3]